MTVSDALKILVDNPLTNGTVYATKVAWNTTAGWLPGMKAAPLPQKLPGLSQLAGSGAQFVRLAGVSGAIAVGLGAYGAHRTWPSEHQSQVCEISNRYHFFHTLALLGVPMARYPMMTGTLFSAGMVLFCGSCYHQSFTGKDTFRKMAPIGGICLILGWCSFVI